MKKLVIPFVLYCIAQLGLGCDSQSRVPAPPPAPTGTGGVVGNSGTGGSAIAPSPDSSTALPDASILSDSSATPDLATIGPDLGPSAADAPIDAPLLGVDAPAVAPPSTLPPLPTDDPRCVSKSPGQYVSLEPCSPTPGSSNGLLVCRRPNTVLVAVCEAQTVVVIAQDASPSVDTASVADAQPTDALTLASDALTNPDTPPDAVCREGVLDQPLTVCVVTLDSGGTTLGYWGC